MTEFETPPSSLFFIDKIQLRPISRKLKRTSPEVTSAIQRMSESHPTIKSILGVMYDHFTAESKEFTVPNMGLPLLEGAYMAYATAEAVSYAFGISMPMDTGMVSDAEWMNDFIHKHKDTDATLNPYGLLVEGSFVPEFAKRLPTYHEAALDATARIVNCPARHLRDVMTATNTEWIEGRLFSQDMGMSIEGYISSVNFVSGYGLTMLALQDFQHAEQLSQIEI